MRTTFTILLLVVKCVSAAAAKPAEDAWFAPYRTVAEYRPKGPSHCFRQFNIDWSWIGRSLDELPAFLSQADPAALAEFCKQDHLDGTIVMAVPHHGYCTYETKIGTKFPGMKGDWFGRTTEELHKRKISVFAYVTINWNWKYMRDNQGKDFIHGKSNPDGSFETSALICLNAPGYLDLVEAYTREVIEGYPIDGMRWDILYTAQGCICAGCKKYYRQLYGEELQDWRKIDPRRQQDFYIATNERAVRRLAALCRRIKPSLEIWQNGVNCYAPNNMNLSRIMDIAYNEYGDPFRLLLNKGVANKSAVINGLMNNVPTDPSRLLDNRAFRICLILGGRSYSYYGHKQTDPRTLMPDAAMTAWHKKELAPFYAMVRDIQPYLEGSLPVSPIGVVYGENTRFRYPGYHRTDYLKPIERLTYAYLERSLPLEFVNCLDLPNPEKKISRFKLLIVPLTSGLADNELEALRCYVRKGGNLLVAGEALRHDAKGIEIKDFALAKEMGVSFESVESASQGWKWNDTDIMGRKIISPQKGTIKTLVRVRPTEGETLLSIDVNGHSRPLLHLNCVDRGKVAYLASLDCLELTQSVIDRLAGPLPVTVTPSDKQIILTYQEMSKCWILHLMSSGQYTIHLVGTDAAQVVSQYPADNWNYESKLGMNGLQIKVYGDTQNRLLVLRKKD